jgi:hypothetical protein
LRGNAVAIIDFSHYKILMAHEGEKINYLISLINYLISLNIKIIEKVEDKTMKKILGVLMTVSIAMAMGDNLKLGRIQNSQA